jgi:hypothetical protein
MADDLSKPLLGPGGRRGKKLSLPGMLLTVLAVALIGVAAWVVIAAVPDAKDQETVGVDPQTVGEIVIAMPEGQQSGVVITTPGGDPVGGDGALIRNLGAAAQVTLSARPEPSLIEAGRYGLLPKVADDGWRPFDAYARPPDPIGGQPVRIAIIVGGIGINQAGSELAMARLPGEVTLALAPYGSNLATWAARGREAGHELLLQIPLEPIDFPLTDPGPHTLIAGDPATDNIDRLRWLMTQFQTYVGVVSYTGGRFLADIEALQPVIAELARRGLMFVDEGAVQRSQASQAALGTLPFVAADLVLDAEVNAASIAARLDELVAIARSRGYAVASASAYPVTIQAIEQWALTAGDQGVVLVPITALANDPQTDATRVQLD